jgi:pimeloyl-ACP methyl ester carboxylesterase
LLPLTELGFTVIGFDGPGQGGTLRQGIYFEHAWEKPAKAVLDYFKLEAVDWLGASCGGYLSIRAAAFEPRIKHIISLPHDILGPRYDVEADGAGQGATVDIIVKAGDRQGTETLVAEQRTPNSVFDWCITQGMHITGTRTPFDFLTAIAQHLLDGILHNVKQDILLTEGEQDHLFNVD